MKRRHPWSLMVIAVAVGGALLCGSALAFYSPLVYQYLMTPADTVVVKKTTLSAAAYDTSRCIRKVSGTAGSYGVDSLGVCDHVNIYATAACSTAVFMNGSTTPVGFQIPANGVLDIRARWVDSTITKDGGSGNNALYIQLDGHKQWFSGGGTY